MAKKAKKRQEGYIDKTLDDWKKDGHWIAAGRRLAFSPMRIGNKD